MKVMKNKIIEILIAILIAIAVWLAFTKTVHGLAYANQSKSEGGIATATTTGLDAQGRNLDNGEGGNRGLEEPCVKTGEREWDCTTKETLLKLKEFVDWKKNKVIKAYVTYYTRASSCHNPKYVGGERLCLTAIGKDTQEGRTVACPYSLKLGTGIKINGHEYVCEDRYSKYLDSQRGLPTFDIFFEGKPSFGRMVAFVEVLP